MNLCDAEENKKYTIIRIIGAYRNRLSELGFSPGCDIYMHKMDKDGPLVANCRGSQIGLRKAEAECILITLATS